MKLYFWYLSCKHFPEITHQYILFAPLFFETFRNICVTLCCKRKAASQWTLFQIFPSTPNQKNSLLTKKICLLCETIFVEEFYTFTKRGTERAFFVFCCSFKVLVFSKNQIRLLCQTPKLFQLQNPGLCVQSLWLMLHNNFLVFNIDNCWKRSHNLWTLPNHNSRSLGDLGFRACYSASAQSPTPRFEN